MIVFLPSTLTGTCASLAAQEMASDVAQVWAHNGTPLGEGDYARMSEALSEGVGSLHRQGGESTVRCARTLWEAIPYSVSQTAYPLIASPWESALGHLNGLFLLRKKWGDAVAHAWREGDFASPIRYEIGRNFYITQSPGSHETVAGIDYRLIWGGTDAEGKSHDIILATVGFIRRRNGFAITLVQGGPRLTQIKVADQGKPTDLLRLVQRRFVEDPRLWLLREVVVRLREEYPGAKVYWLRAERRAPLYDHVADPLPPHRSLFAKVGRLPLEELRGLIEKVGEKRLPVVVQRLDQMAESLGFRPCEEDGAWRVLSTRPEA